MNKTINHKNLKARQNSLDPLLHLACFPAFTSFFLTIYEFLLRFKRKGIKFGSGFIFVQAKFSPSKIAFFRLAKIKPNENLTSKNLALAKIWDFTGLALRAISRRAQRRGR